MKLVLQNEQNSDKVRWAFRKSAAKRQHKGQNTNLLFQKISEAREMYADPNGGEVSNPYRLMMMIWHLFVTHSLRTSSAYKYC